jgi:predicted alpha/beta-fold hydrolase
MREVLETEDGDFLLLDWVRNGNHRLAVVSHGLEGDSSRHYVTGMVNALSGAGWDVLAWNFRGCGGSINRKPRFTHNGATDDLDAVVRCALAKGDYSHLSLVGFSMGGNLSLVYLGRDAEKVPEEVKGAVCFSVPCDLAAASQKLAEPQNAVYMKRFMRMMGEKVRLQSENYPEHFPCSDYHLLKTFADFDSRYTAPLHGFESAEHYWYECSSTRYLENIRVPAWIVNAVNDPFLVEACSPHENDHGNSFVTTLRPRYGGHCGFVSSASEDTYWSEELTVKLLVNSAS